MSDDKPKKVPKSRVFNCLQYEQNPRTGQDLHFSEQNIIECMKHKTITRYAYIRHDKDVVTEWDIETGKGAYTEDELGNIKPPHWHIVIETAHNYTPVDTIARWLGIPAEFVNLPKGRGAFIDCVEYLCHSDIKQELKGKYIYDPAEVRANFDWQTEVEAMVLRKTKYEKPLSEEEFLKNEVLYNGMSLAEVQEKHPTIYAKEMTVFDRLRMKYITEKAPLPTSRVNLYIEGGSGYGKDTMARSVARALFPELADKPDDDIFFEIGDSKVTFEGYDGQPVIIWSEFRADTFVNALGGYEAVLGAIDVIPKNNRHHKKFGSVRLVNSVNIVTSTQPYEDFLKGLIPKSDPDPTQANRRFPLIIPIHLNDFDILINSGYLDADTYKDYTAFMNIKGNFGQMAKMLSCRPEALRQVEAKMSQPITEAHDMIKGKLVHDDFGDLTDEEIVMRVLDDGVGQYAQYVRKTDEELQKEYQEFLAQNPGFENRIWSEPQDEELARYTTWLISEANPYKELEFKND